LAQEWKSDRWIRGTRGTSPVVTGATAAVIRSRSGKREHIGSYRSSYKGSSSASSQQPAASSQQPAAASQQCMS